MVTVHYLENHQLEWELEGGFEGRVFIEN